MTAPDRLMVRIGAVVTDLLDRSEVTKFAVAETAGLSRPSLRRRLTGSVPFNVEELVQICEALGGDLDPSDVVAMAQGWVATRQLHADLARRFSLDELIVRAVAHRLSQEAPARYLTYGVTARR